VRSSREPIRFLMPIVQSLAHKKYQ